MNEDVKEYLEQHFDCHCIGEETYAVHLPLYYPNSDKQITIGCLFDNEKLIISDMCELVQDIVEVRPNYFLEQSTLKTIEKYNCEYSNGKILMHSLTCDTKEAISEFCFMIVVLIDKL